MASEIERFCAKVQKQDEDGCWEWFGGRTSSWYPPQAESWYPLAGLPEEVRRALPLALAGKLTEADAARFAVLPSEDREVRGFQIEQAWLALAPPVLSFRAKYAWVARAAWALYTVEYQDSLQRLLEHLGCESVVELGAGLGLLQAPMVERGLTWYCSDEDPSPRAIGQVSLGDAKESAGAALASGFDAMFCSWPPMGTSIDVDLAQLVHEFRAPLLLVGEPGGCTGSSDFWLAYCDDPPEGTRNGTWVGRPREILRDFRDVPVWPTGVNDRTLLLLPAGHHAIPE